jgi:sphingomyelin phosphodiesterase
MGRNVPDKMFTSLVSLMACASVVCAGGIQSSSYVVPGAFPTTAYASYWNSPTATSAQVQPVISDPVSVSSNIVS